MGILRLLFYVMTSWYVVSMIGRWHWLFALVVTITAILNVVVVWMLRQQRHKLAIACRREFVRKYVAGICYLTGDQVPNEDSASNSSRAILLRTANDFDVAARRAKQIVRGHDGVLDRAFARVSENLTLRKSRRSGKANGPLASFLLIGEEGIGKRYLAQVLAKLLYGNGGIEVFDAARLTVGELVGAKSSPGELLTIAKEGSQTLILFEHIEKAKPEISNLLVRLLTQGCLYPSGADSPVSFHDATIVFTTTPSEFDVSTVDRELLNSVTEVMHCQTPDDYVKAEVVALTMTRECTSHNIELTHVDPEIIATQIMHLDESSGFRLLPQSVHKLLRKPLVAAAPGRHKSLSLRIRNGETLTINPQ